MLLFEYVNRYDAINLKVSERKRDGEMTISKEKYKCLKTMTNDLMNAEYFINNLGVETRIDFAGTEFRDIVNILKDVVTVCSNNSTILDDCAKFLASNPETKNDSDNFLSKYNLEGIYRIVN